MAKLQRLDKLKELIDTKVKQIYEEHGNLTVELADEFLHRKGSNDDPILRVPLTINLGKGQSWELRPNYMKNGQFTNLIWKPTGVQAFSINHLISE